MNKKIMIIEDDDSIRNNLQLLLESEGYSVETATDGRAALDQLSAATTLPSLIILDLMMPVMDGVQFRKEQLNDPKLSTIPVVLATAGVNIESKTLLVGAQGQLKKPFDLYDFLSTVKRFVR